MDKTEVIMERFNAIKDKLNANEIENQILKERIKNLEDRLNIMMAIKKNGLDINKFVFDLQPLVEK